MPVMYATVPVKTLSEPGALLMQDFQEINGGIVNKADGLTLAQVSIELLQPLQRVYCRSSKSLTTSPRCTRGFSSSQINRVSFVCRLELQLLLNCKDTSVLKNKTLTSNEPINNAQGRSR